ncbi:MAG: HDOD domain-containing protein [Proteobacteria bacterium]|nr:HDOD domain-containing protein [Pseudomonadota bacterium]
MSIGEIVRKEIAANRTHLPLFEGTGARLQEILSSQSFDVDEVDDIVSGDLTLTSAVLRASNSSFFGGLEKVESVRDAIMRIGVKKVAQLALLISQKQHFRVKTPEYAPYVEAIWRHSVAAAMGAQWLAEKLRLADIASKAFLCGLLHDVGQLFVLRVVDDLRQSKRHRFDPSESLVLEVLSAMHTECGEELMRSWNIPELYCDVVRHHHDRDFDERDELLVLVRLIDQACNKLGIGPHPDPDRVLSHTPEAQVLRVSDVVLAELEILLEDALQIAEA